MAETKIATDFRAHIEAFYDYNTFTSDEAIIPIRGGDWYDGGFWERLFTQQWTEKDGELYATWCYLYKVVMLCNQSSEALKAHKAVLTDEQYQSYNAEIRALRAMYYFYLWICLATFL